jgi:hypothetical protein
MAGFSEEKRTRLQGLAKGRFLQSSDPSIDAFLRRIRAVRGRFHVSQCMLGQTDANRTFPVVET